MVRSNFFRRAHRDLFRKDLMQGKAFILDGVQDRKIWMHAHRQGADRDVSALS